MPHTCWLGQVPARRCGCDAGCMPWCEPQAAGAAWLCRGQQGWGWGGGHTSVATQRPQEEGHASETDPPSAAYCGALRAAVLMWCRSARAARAVCFPPSSWSAAEGPPLERRRRCVPASPLAAAPGPAPAMLARSAPLPPASEAVASEARGEARSASSAPSSTCRHIVGPRCVPRAVRSCLFGLRVCPTATDFATQTPWQSGRPRIADQWRPGQRMCRHDREGMPGVCGRAAGLEAGATAGACPACLGGRWPLGRPGPSLAGKGKGQGAPSLPPSLSALPVPSDRARPALQTPLVRFAAGGRGGNWAGAGAGLGGARARA